MLTLSGTPDFTPSDCFVSDLFYQISQNVVNYRGSMYGIGLLKWIIWFSCHNIAQELVILANSKNKTSLINLINFINKFLIIIFRDQLLARIVLFLGLRAKSG